jgi:poly(A) polymerase Pap1
VFPARCELHFYKKVVESKMRHFVGKLERTPSMDVMPVSPFLNPHQHLNCCIHIYIL